MKVEVYWHRPRLGQEPEEIHTLVEEVTDCQLTSLFLMVDTVTGRTCIPVKEILEYYIDYKDEILKEMRETQCVH